MNVDVTSRQLQLLKELVDSRIGEIHPEIRRSRTYTVHDELQNDLEILRDLQGRLAAQQSQACEPSRA